MLEWKEKKPNKLWKFHGKMWRKLSPTPYLEGIILGWEGNSAAKIIPTQEEILEFSPSIYLKGDMNF